MPDGTFVPWDKWDGEHKRLQDRVDRLEEDIGELKQANERRAGRQWQVMLAFLTALVLPLVVLAVVALVTAHP